METITIEVNEKLIKKLTIAAKIDGVTLEEFILSSIESDAEFVIYDEENN